MSSSYSSLDWVLSHWVHFTVHCIAYLVVFICVYFVFFFHTAYYVVLLSAQWGGPNGIEACSLGPLPSENTIIYTRQSIKDKCKIHTKHIIKTD